MEQTTSPIESNDDAACTEPRDSELIADEHEHKPRQKTKETKPKRRSPRIKQKSLERPNEKLKDSINRTVRQNTIDFSNIDDAFSMQKFAPKRKTTHNRTVKKANVDFHTADSNLVDEERRDSSDFVDSISMREVSHESRHSTAKYEGTFEIRERKTTHNRTVKKANVDFHKADFNLVDEEIKVGGPSMKFYFVLIIAAVFIICFLIANIFPTPAPPSCHVRKNFTTLSEDSADIVNSALIYSTSAKPLILTLLTNNSNNVQPFISELAGKCFSFTHVKKSDGDIEFEAKIANGIGPHEFVIVNDFGDLETTKLQVIRGFADFYSPKQPNTFLLIIAQVPKDLSNPEGTFRNYFSSKFASELNADEISPFLTRFVNHIFVC